ncbi:hypothetical protein SAMN02910447_03007 [Ruminococcus sp. YE71]|uniref:hypothetical protein n=1 Tax=unclassified Ruminococcus TaxID=2608920 RepID=UPI00087EA8CC|nr:MULTISPECIES: hypothetical protein [unclassified Ruminococcus]SDA29263.1 hypothetical protein SAMN02910446_03078 [Ruminococcus sp. YE78]SFW47879.1 hypothetical protein SAMN02910447_03007 [Ruminococcus sp. YE71]
MRTAKYDLLKAKNNEVIETAQKYCYNEITWAIGDKGNLIAYKKNNNIWERFPKLDYQPISQEKQHKKVKFQPKSDTEKFRLYDGYFVSTEDRIYSTKTNEFLSIHDRSQNTSYKSVDLCKNGKQHTVAWSNIVAALFDDGFDRRYSHLIIADKILDLCKYDRSVLDFEWDNFHVHHINRDTTDNRACNLIILSDRDHSIIHQALKSRIDLDTYEKVNIYLDKNGG